MRLYEFHELSLDLQHLAVGVSGGLVDLLFDYDRERQALRWWRMGASPNSTLATKGAIPIPVDLVPEAEKMINAAASPSAADLMQH
jgi:hypothetical protein